MDFFDVNKLTSHLRRVQDSSEKKKVSGIVGDLVKARTRRMKRMPRMTLMFAR
jgi:hypothetical protein